MPKEFGPEDVGVILKSMREILSISTLCHNCCGNCLPMFFIRIFASAGISSASSSLSLLNASATVIFGCALLAAGALSLSEIPMIGFLNEADKLLGAAFGMLMEIFGGGGAFDFCSESDGDFRSRLRRE